MIDEMREKLARLVCPMDDCEDLPCPCDCVTPDMMLLVCDILSLETDTCRIAVRPNTKIICLCGSTRFTSEMLVTQWELTKQGHIVLSWCALPDWYFDGEDKAHIGDQEGVKEIVDVVHFRKIDLADEVWVLNIGGYIGESTRNELNYARSLGKPIVFLEPEAGYVQEVKDE